MNRTLMTLSLGLGIAALAALPAPAQSARCADHERVVTFLAESYGESRQSIGLASNNMVVEVFANLDSGTWTITMTAPGGPTCLVASGEGHQQIAEGLPNTDAPA
ncbi:hypothetical protein EU803_01145 [Loktanella sp. IMCC34160]|uniref:hypothetical protein n=1 Tax=Rhodobacterales TaxID=204455 RepID=UPI00101DF277|nr:hypothetical protein [Loktanella sp. IMCC34160]RYG92742.1 hypothetical protein EU803_01145 [Loktanella sp. IMCC34160]